MLKDKEKQEIKCYCDIMLMQEEYCWMWVFIKVYWEYSFERYDFFLKKKSVVCDVMRILGYIYVCLW